MKINITKKQYWDLMRATYLADWMENAICDADMEQDDAIKNTRNFIFSFAKEMGYENYVMNDKESGIFFPTLQMDDDQSTRSLIDRYDDHAFWEEMSDRLGERDFLQKYSREEIKAMSEEKRFTLLMRCGIVWEDEFGEYGIERLKIDKTKK